MDVLVCEGTVSDIPECLGIARGLPAYFTQSALDQMERDLAAEGIMVARKDARVAGFLCLKAINVNVWEILWLAVQHSLSGQGIGTALLDSACRDLASRGVRLLTVKTLAPSVDYPPYARTRRFYEKNGFLLIEEIDPYPKWDPGNPCAIYVKPLR